MRVGFRQGLVQAPPSFLQLTPALGVTLNVFPPQAFVVNFAHGQSNYLLTVLQQVTNAWTGPFFPGNDYWLYVDIDTTTGVTTYGHTTLLPVAQTAAPGSPAVNQHWFDTTNFIMKVWSGASWVPRIRVFAAKLQAGTTFVSVSINAPGSFVGTQAGFAGQVPVNSGAICFDVFDKPIRKSQNHFFTTEDYVIAGTGSAVQVKTASLLVTATAAEPIPAFSVVRFTDYNTVALATNYLLDNGVYGIVEFDADEDQPCTVVTEGVVYNEMWDWSAYPINTPLYVGPTGELTPTEPPIKIPVAAIIDKQSILLRPSSFFLGGQTTVATQSQLGNVLLSVPSVPPSMVGNIVAVTPGANGTFTIAGDWAQDLMVAREFVVTGNSDGPTNNTYYVYSAAAIGPNTVITVDEPGIPGTATVSGVLTFDQLPRVITETDPRISGGNTLTPTEALFLSTVALAPAGIVAKDAIGNGFTRTITGTGGNIAITNGDGVAGNPTIDLVDAGTPVSNSLVKITTDAKGRVTSTSAVVTGDLTPTLDGTYVNVSGDAMTGALSMGNNKITLLGTPTLSTDAATKGYVDSAISGGTVTSVAATAPAAGFTITGSPITGTGTFVFTLADDLAALEGLAGTGIAVRTASNTWANRSVTSTSGTIAITNPAGIAGNINVDLPNVGTPVTASFVKITTDAQGRISGTTAVTTGDITPLVDSTFVNASGDTMTGTLTMSGGATVTGLPTPTNSADAASKAYVDTATSGLSWKAAVKAATTVPGTLATSFQATSVIDDITLIAGDRILIKNQATASENGIYVVQATGAPVRATDANTANELDGAAVFVQQGTTNADTAWIQTANVILVDITPLVFTQFGAGSVYVAGSGLTLTGNSFSANVTGASTGIVTNNIAVRSTNTAGQVLRSTGTAGTEATWGALDLANTSAVTGVLDEANGGTGQSTFTTGDILYASGANTLTKLTIGTTDQILQVVGGVPTWQTTIDGGTF